MLKAIFFSYNFTGDAWHFLLYYYIIIDSTEVSAYVAIDMAHETDALTLHVEAAVWLFQSDAIDQDPEQR